MTRKKESFGGNVVAAGLAAIIGLQGWVLFSIQQLKVDVAVIQTQLAAKSKMERAIYAERTH